mmetsp:Transcript_18367/g.46989  ORF Transcript_18367/g.46989 Transcript_18367/m.46989 type:complete len:316 (+) Transcript_18367:320-1267(+)
MRCACSPRAPARSIQRTLSGASIRRNVLSSCARHSSAIATASASLATTAARMRASSTPRSTRMTAFSSCCSSSPSPSAVNESGSVCSPERTSCATAAAESAPSAPSTSADSFTTVATGGTGVERCRLADAALSASARGAGGGRLEPECTGANSISGAPRAVRALTAVACASVKPFVTQARATACRAPTSAAAASPPPWAPVCAFAHAARALPIFGACTGHSRATAARAARMAIARASLVPAPSVAGSAEARASTARAPSALKTSMLVVPPAGTRPKSHWPICCVELAGRGVSRTASCSATLAACARSPSFPLASR